MLNLKGLYYGIAGKVKDVCDKTYYMDRPTSVDSKVNTYLVISLPSGIVNKELNPAGDYNFYSTTIALEVYVRDKMSASNPVAVNLGVMDEKVKKILAAFPIDVDGLFVTRPQVVMQDNDGSGFHVTFIRARLTTK